MKKSLLLFVSYVLAAVSVFAQQPAKPQPTFTSWVENKEVYLYNVEAGLFLVGGNEWGTNACLITNGSKAWNNHITYSQFMHGSASIEGTPWIIVASDENRGPSSDDYTYSFQRSTDSKLFLAVAGDNRAWVDGGPEGVEKDYAGWTVVKKNADKTFQLGYIRKVERKDGEGNVIKEDDKVVYDFVAEKGVYGVYKFDTDTLTTYINENEAYSTWALVAPADYDEVLPQLQLYYAYPTLENLINDARALGFAKDFSKYENLLTKAGATLKEFEDAIAELKTSYEFGKIIKDAESADPNRSWDKFKAIYSDETSTTEVIETNTKLINALLDLYKVIDEGQTLDAAHDYTAAKDVYNSDASTQEQIEAKTKLVKAFVSLKKTIDEAIEKGCTVDDYVTVYNNASSTEAQLAEAEAAVKDLIEIADINAAVANATFDNPAEVTRWIVNPDFSTDNFTGWTNKDNKGAVGSKCAEAYGKADFDVYQEVKNLPVGVYEISVQGFYRYVRPEGGAYDIYKNQEIPYVKPGGSPVFVYLNNMTTPFVNIYAEPKEEGFYSGGYQKTSDNTFFPNDMASAATAFGAGMYTQKAYGLVKDGEIMRIGVKGNTNEPNNNSWVIFDNFKLSYKGDKDEAYQKLKEIFNYTEFEKEEGAYYGKPELDAYDGFVQTLSTATDKETISSVLTEMDAAIKAVETSKTNYAEYVELLNTAYAWIEENNGDNDSYDILDNYLAAEDPEDVAEFGFPNGPALYIIPDFLDGGTVGILSAEKIAEEKEYLKGIYDEAVKNTLTNGSDLTNVLTNPDFSTNNFTGWTNKDNKGAVGSKCAEAYGKADFDVYQEVEGLPEGLYEISVQGFYRYVRPETTPLGAYEIYKNQEISYVKPGGSPVFVYLNNMTTPFVNVYAEPKEEGFYSSGYQKTSDNTFFPNDMASAATAFGVGMYTQKAYGLVKKGEVMRIGVKGSTNAPNNNSWVIFDNFKLTYRAQDATAAGEVLKMKAAELRQLLDENGENNMTDKAILAAEAAYKRYQDKISDEVNYQILGEVNDALVAAQENVEAVEKYKQILKAYNDAYTELDAADPAGEEEIWGDIDAMDKEAGINDGDDAFKDFTTDELVDLSTRMEQLTAKMQNLVKALPTQKDIEDAEEMINDLAAATDEAPVDVTKYMVNPGFEDEETLMNGWTYEKVSGDTGAVLNSDSKFTINDERCGKRVFNIWSSKAPEGGFYVAQTIKALPAGTYLLTAILASDAGNTITLSANDTSADFTMTGDKATAFDAVLFFTIGEDQASESPLRKAQAYTNVEIKAKSNTWFKADNFKLKYYGPDSEVTPTDIDVIDVQPANVKDGKFIMDGQLIIVKDGLKYNAVGVLLP